ncbi:MAG: Yip1 family protein [Sandaracinaceae bacterium]
MFRRQGGDGPKAGVTPGELAPRRCEEHPDAERLPCERCGDFHCVDCVPFDAPPRCASCRARHGIEDVPWERSGVSIPRRWAETTRAFVFRPGRTLERTRPARVLPPLRFLLNTAVLTLLAIWLVVFSRDALEAGLSHAPRALLPPALLGLVLSGMTLLRLGLFHGLCKLLGGTGSVAASLASIAYLQAILVVYAPVSLSTWVPSLSPLLLSLTALAIEAFLAVNLTTAATLRHRLSTGRAAVAAWSPFVFVLFAWVFGCGFFGLLIDASALPR